MIVPIIETFDKEELEDPNQLESMLEFLRSIENELPFEVLVDDGDGNITERFGKQE